MGPKGGGAKSGGEGAKRGVGRGEVFVGVVDEEVVEEFERLTVESFVDDVVVFLAMVGIWIRHDADAIPKRAGETSSAQHSRLLQLARRQLEHHLVQRTHRGVGRHTQTQVAATVVVVAAFFGGSGGGEKELPQRLLDR